ncbi:MAG: PQQ-binding-like beta-propeller repeat protein [Verrucomicrobiota bacterium]
MSRTLGLFSCLLAFIASSHAQTPAAGDWIHSRGDEAMQGRSPVELRFPLELAWQHSMMAKPKGQAEMLVSGAVVRAGKVYAGCKDGKFRCLDLAKGEKIWEAEGKGAFDGAASFAGELVVAGCQDGFVYAWNAETGKEVWKYETEAEIHAAANTWTDPATQAQKILIGSYDYKVYCLDAKTGKQDWAAETGYYINGGSAVGDGKVVFGGCDSVLHVHDVKTGKEERQIEVGAYIGNNVAISEGVIYVSHYGNHVGAYAMADGAKVWEYGEREFEYYAAPAIWEKAVFCGGRDKRFHAIDRTTGAQLWEYRCRDRIDSSAVICAGKAAVFGADDGYVYALDTKDGKELWQYEVGAPVKTSPAVAGDHVIFGADDGNIYCFKSAAAVAGTPPAPAEVKKP